MELLLLPRVVFLLALALIETVHDLFLDAFFDFFFELFVHLTMRRYGPANLILVRPAIDCAIAQEEVVLCRLRH